MSMSDSPNLTLCTNNQFVQFAVITFRLPCFIVATCRAIPNVTTFVDDITSESCRSKLKKQMQTWKADCVLNDGAPNVGTAWVQDAFSQG